MYIANPGNSRPQYYDRNATVHFQSYIATAVAPHANTVRWTYTVPTNQKAFIDFVRLLVHRDAAATAAAEADLLIVYGPASGGGAPFIAVDESQNALTVYNQVIQTNLGIMFAGDDIQAQSQDASTGGTYTYAVAAKIDQFDA